VNLGHEHLSIPRRHRGPHRSHQRGTYVLDRQFRGLGSLKRSSGTDDPALFRVAELERLFTAETMRGLRGAREMWVASAEASGWHRQARTCAIRAVLRVAKQDATVQDLPALLRTSIGGLQG